MTPVSKSWSGGSLEAAIGLVQDTHADYAENVIGGIEEELAESFRDLFGGIGL